MRKKIKKSYKNHKCKISAPTWYGKFKLPNGSFSVLDIQDHFQYIIKKHDVLLGHMTKTLTYNPPVKIYINKIEKRITEFSYIEYGLQIKIVSH